MNKIKKNLPVILLSISATLLLVAVILLIHGNNTFKISNTSSKENNNKENTKVIKEENKKEESKEENKQENTPQVIDNSNNTQPSNVEEEATEESVINYFTENESLFSKENSGNESLTSKLKTGFISVVDFIFYEKEIKGYTFKELTNAAKLKIISIALSIDNKIDKYFPNYKAVIKDKYTTVKGKLALKYLEITSNFCSSDPDTCAQAKIDFNNMKKSFNLTFDLLKEMTKSGTSKLRVFYENWKEE